MKTLLTAAVLAAGLFSATVQAAPLKIGVSAGPYGEIMEFTATIAAKEGLEVKVIEFTDWNMPNAALQAGDIDANHFQHQPFLDSQIRQRGYDIVAVAKSVVVPMGIYAKKVKSIADIKNGGTISIPNDPTNAARALVLLADAGLITLKDGGGFDASVFDIASNPKGLTFVELDAAQLPRSLEDVEASVITLNYAVSAGIDLQEALKLENDQSKWHLVWAARKDRQDNPALKRFLEIFRSAEVRQFILTRFKGSIIPTW